MGPAAATLTRVGTHTHHAHANSHWGMCMCAEEIVYLPARDTLAGPVRGQWGGDRKRWTVVAFHPHPCESHTCSLLAHGVRALVSLQSALPTETPPPTPPAQLSPGVSRRPLSKPQPGARAELLSSGRPSRGPPPRHPQTSLGPASFIHASA